MEPLADVLKSTVAINSKDLVVVQISVLLQIVH